MSNIQAVGLFRELDAKKKYSRDTVLPSKASVVRAARLVEQYGMTICPYTFGRLPEEAGGCEYFYFNLNEVVPIALRAHGLDEIAKERSTFWGQALDGLCFSKNLGAVNYVLKMQDRDAVNVCTKKPLFDGSICSSSLQSNQNVIPVMCVLGKETRALTQIAFKKPFDTMNLEANATEFSPLLGSPYRPLKVAVNGDMKVAQNGLGKGGAFKVKKNPCHICDIHDDDIIAPNKELCSRWCRKWEEEESNEMSVLPGAWCGKCYHKEWLSEEAKETLLEDIWLQDECIESYLGDVEEMDIIRENSFINVDEDPRGEGEGNSCNDVNSIFYNYRNANPDGRKTFLSNVFHDLVERNAELAGTWEQKVQRLRDFLIEEYRMVRLKRRFEHSELGKEDALFLLENAVPCSLHLENRVALKLLNMLFLRGWENACKKLLFPKINSKRKRVAALASDMGGIFNRRILGTPENPMNWEFPLDKKTNELYDYSTGNGSCRRILEYYDDLDDVCLIKEEEQWKEAARNFKKSMLLLNRREEFTH